MSRSIVEMAGQVAPGFEPVRAAFERNFAEHGEVGAALCCYLEGEPVVDLWGGMADVETQRRWERDTPVLLFSTSKGVTAACVHLLAQRGDLDLEAPVAVYWPEFAALGKDAIRVCDVLAHRAGLPTLEGEFTAEEVYEWEPVVRALERQTPIWEPGAEHGYHVRTFGWILGEVIRRVTDMSLGRFLATEIAAPLALDLWIGLDGTPRTPPAPVLPPPVPTDPGMRALRDQFLGPETLLGQALTGPSGLFAYGPIWNTAALHAAEMPSSNGIGTARAVARLYASLVGAVDGIRLLEPATIERTRTCVSDGPDRVIHVPTRFGLGFMLPPVLGSACPPSAFGHPGAGGSLGFADPDRRVGFGYVMNKMDMGLTGDPRATALTEAFYRCLG